MKANKISGVLIIKNKKINSNISYYELAKLDKKAYAKLLTRPSSNLQKYLTPSKKIVTAVKAKGDKALVEFAKKFDGATIKSSEIKVSKKEFEAAEKKLDAKLKQSIKFAVANITRFHKQQLPKSTYTYKLQAGVGVKEKLVPLVSVGCYTPRGKGSFPSVCMMTAIPAVVAGVKQVVMFTPPGSDGTVDAATLYAAKLAGVTTVIKAGGAVAVAAAAFGTKTVPKCRKFEGPGSNWISAAKFLCKDLIDSRLPAGASESIIFADNSVPARKIALDLLIESEHGVDSSTFLVTTDKKLATKVAELIPKYWQQMDVRGRKASKAVLGGSNGGVVIASNKQQAYAFINDYAPEHLQIMTKNPEADEKHITNAAEILLGEHTPGSIANYIIGPSCVLPTSGGAHIHSPLGVHDFLKRIAIAKLSKAAYKKLAPHTKRLAEYEGFSGHANAVSDLRK